MLAYSMIQAPARGIGEDRASVITHDDCLIAAVADGAGGLGGGAHAAEVAVAMATTTTDSGVSALPLYWTTRLRDIDQALAAKCDGQAALVVATIINGQVLGAAVGDAIAWLVSPTGVSDVTADTPRKPLLGDGAASPRAFGPSPLHASTLLLATDGLWKYVPRETIAQRVLQARNLEQCPELIDAARLRSGTLQDDIAVVLIRDTDVGS